MGWHEEFRELCAVATAGELSADEHSRLSAHLAVCPDCRRMKGEYEAAAGAGVATLAESYADTDEVIGDGSWFVERAQERFFKRLTKEDESASFELSQAQKAPAGKRLTYRPALIRWPESWMPFAAAILLAVALGIAAYRSGVKRGIDTTLKIAQPPRESENSLEAQVSDAGYERSQLQAQLADSAKTIDDLKRQLAEQIKIVNSLTEVVSTPAASAESPKESQQSESSPSVNRDAELIAAEAKLVELQRNVDAATAQRDENARQAAILEANVNELTELVRSREEALDQREAEVAKGQELLEHDRDIRELMGARELYMADVHDVSGRGTEKTYGRVFYTKGRSLIFYAFDLGAQPGFQNAKSFQAWGRKGPDRAQAHSLGIFYEDNASKKRWVLKANDPKTLKDIDAVFVTVEPRGGSQHPSGKQLLFASLRISPNHP
jgi:Anti-sigma-K factor rskA/Putative zinc-finger